MKSFYILIPLILLCFGLQAQKENTQKLENYIKQNKIKALQTDDGLYYFIDKKGKGNQPKEGDYVVIDYEGKLLDGTTFDKTPKEDPFVFQYGLGPSMKGLDLGMALFNVGSEGTLYIPAELALGKTGDGKMIPPNAPLIFEIKMKRIMDYDGYSAYMKKIEEKEKRSFETHVKTQFLKDKKLINDYCADNKLKATRTENGVNYVVKKKGKGDLIVNGDMVTIDYEGYLLDNSKFDASTAADPLVFRLGQNKVIPGLEEGLRNFNNGSEGWIIIPSKLAYGPRSIKEEGVDIPADSVLAFKVKVRNVEPPAFKQKQMASKKGKKKRKRKG